MKELGKMKVVFDSEYFNELRKEKKLKQLHVADMIGIHQSSISNYICHRKMPCVEILYKMAMALEVSMEDLLREVYE